MQRGVGNVNPMKMAKCIVELERIYGIEHGNNQQENRSSQNAKSIKTQEGLANDIGISVSQLQRYKQLLKLIPELQDLVEHNKESNHK